MFPCLHHHPLLRRFFVFAPISTRPGARNSSLYRNTCYAGHCIISIINHLVFSFISCSPSCPTKVNIDQKLPLEGTCKVCFGELTFSWELFRHKELGTDPVDTGNMVKISKLQDLSTTSITSLNLALKENALHRDTGYTAFFRAYRQNGQYGEYIHTFVTNSPPENGKQIL